MIKGHPKQQASFVQRPLEHLTCRCNQVTKEARTKADNKNNEINVRFIRHYVTKIKNKIVTNSEKEMMRIADRKKSTNEHFKKKFPNNYDLIDIGARNAFSNKTVTSSMVACSHGFNHCSLWEVLINNNNKGSDCPR